MLAMQPFSGKLRCPCVRGSRPSQSARRTGHTLSLVVRVDQRQGHPPSRPPIKIKIPALCLRRTQTQGRGTLHLKLMQAEKAKPTQVVVEPDKATETPLGMTPWSDKKGLVRPDEFEDFLWNNGPDPLLLAITRLWEERERRKRPQAASLESAGEEGLAPGTIQACRARGARVGKAHSARSRR
jgi:hypothetical protein